MKSIKMLLAALVVVSLAACSSSIPEECPQCEVCESTEGTTYVDSYSSASSTRFVPTGDDLNAVKDTLVRVSSDLASLADSQKEGYAEPADAIIVQIMSVNPDGSVGLSTIHAWKYDKSSNTVTVELTDGQNARNLAEVGKRGTILAHADGAYFILHLKTTNVEELVYSDEAYNNGEFNSAYSGKDNKLSEFSITFDVMTIEQSYIYMFN